MKYEYLADVPNYLSEIKGNGRPHCAGTSILLKFMEKSDRCCQILFDSVEEAKKAYSTMHNYVIRHGMPLLLSRRQEVLYIVKVGDDK